MRRLAPDEILDSDRYAEVRDSYRALVLEHKRVRRVALGDKLSLVFEDRETVRYQIQEMARIEGLRSASALQRELDVYNELVPGPAELSATLFIEIPDLANVKSELDRLLGIDACVRFVLGEGPRESSVQASFDTRQLEEERISAVHYLRFRFSPQQVLRFASEAGVRLRVDHPACRHEAELTDATRASLLRDLRDDPACLLDPSEALRTAPRRDETLFASGRVRAYRPAEPLAAEHVVIEPLEPLGSLLGADAELLGELMRAAQRLAGELTQRHARCRILIDVEGAESGSGLRVHVLSAPC